MNANLNRALLSYTDRNGRAVTVIANDDRSLSPNQMQQWVDSMNQYLISTGAYAKGSRYYLG